MSDPHASCDLQDITRARITQDIGVVAVINIKGVLLAISSGHSDRGWVKREVCMDDIGEVTIIEVFHKDIVSAIKQGIAFCANEKPPKARTYACDIFFFRKTFVSMLAQSDGKLVLEIEDFDRTLLAVNAIVDTANVIGKLTTNTGQVETVNDLCEAVFEHSAYDRVMTYKFLDDLSGEVIHELKNDDVVKSSFLGMRFPAGDIPLPARKAYVENPVRFIADVDKPSCYVIQKDHDISLSRSFLRGCVAPHKAYLQAMEVRSSLSIAITNTEGLLWGLVVMHSYTKPIVPTIEDRVSYAILSFVTSSHVQHIQNVERLAMETRIRAVVSQIDPKQSLGIFIVQNQNVLMEMFNVNSISVFSPDGEATTVGENGATPEEIPPEDTTNQLTYCRLDRPLRSLLCLSVLGYRLAFTRACCSYNHIRWAGNPRELTLSEVSPDMVMPRQSFEQYLDYRSLNPPPFTKQDRDFFAMTGDLMKSSVHQMRLAYAEKKIEQARRHNESVEMKSDEDYAFFANMSHELRTPLHAISGVFDIIKDFDDDDDVTKIRDAIRRYASIGLNTCKDMMKTLDDILAIVKKTHEQDKVDVSLVMVKEIFNSTSNGLEMFATRNGVGLGVTYDCEINRLVRVDVHKTIQIYNNICGNAIKFGTCDAESASMVEVRIEILDSRKSVQQLWTTVSGGFAGRLIATEDLQVEESKVLHKWLVFQTRDYGVGIHQDDMKKVFKKFSQIDDVATKKFSSTGLGLHITIVNVKAMRGFLAVASTPGKGTLFVCALPVEDASGQTKKVADSTADPTQGFGNDLVNFVVVDDSKVNVMIAKKQIERVFVNAKVHTAANGKLGVEQVERLIEERVHVDGIFMDYHMPVMSGIDSTREIRKKSIRAPITMLTADITETSRQSMIATGIDLILLKPSKPREIVEMCAQMIRMAKN